MISLLVGDLPGKNSNKPLFSGTDDPSDKDFAFTSFFLDSGLNSLMIYLPDGSSLSYSLSKHLIFIGGN